MLQTLRGKLVLALLLLMSMSLKTRQLDGDLWRWQIMIKRLSKIDLIRHIILQNLKDHTVTFQAFSNCRKRMEWNTGPVTAMSVLQLISLTYAGLALWGARSRSRASTRTYTVLGEWQNTHLNVFIIFEKRA